MYVLNGFVPHPAMVNNVPGQHNPIGELSTYALTFTKEKGIYQSTKNYPIRLISFFSQNDGLDTEVSFEFSEHVLDICQFVYQKTLTNPGLAFDTTDFLNDLIDEFSGQAGSFTGGQIKTDSKYYVPEWIKWKKDGSDNEIVIWFADESFRNQYTHYLITVIPPFDRVDDFFLDGEQVQEKLNSYTSSEKTERVQNAKNGHPETVIRLETYNYEDPALASRVLPVDFTVLIYGLAGNNIDAIKQAIIDYILSNSTHPEDEWKEILPDLFKRTEFILIPRWDQYAIEPRQDTLGIFSPIAKVKETVDLMKAKITDYTSFHIETYSTIFSHYHKAVVVGCVGNIENRDNKFIITDYFPDYLNVPSTSLDFDRMSAKTKEWAELIGRMIKIAEDATSISTIDTDLTKMTRNGVLYIVRHFDNVQYLVATKSSIG